MKRWLLVSLALITLLATACRGSGMSDSALGTEPSAETDPMPTAAAAKVEAPAPVMPERGLATADDKSSSGSQGGVFRRLWADPPTLDPHLTGDTTSAGIVVEVFSGLVALNTDLQLIPDIAERWEVDETGTVYTFRIRDKVKFHNGNSVTAADFKWSIERASKPNTASAVVDTYLNDIVGFNDFFEGRADEIAGIRIVDDLTLQITIDAPKAYFLAKLTYPTAYVLDRTTVETGGRSWWIDTPVGTGPFKLTEYRIGERIVLERNEDFYRDPPSVNKVVMNLAGGQAMAMYENDEIDITGVGLFDLDRVLDPNEPLNKELVIAQPGFSIAYIGFNTEKAPFDDVKFRQALNHAIDKDLIAREVLSELVKPAYGILPPSFPGYNPEIKGLEYDQELAKNLLSQSKYADPESRPRIVITVPGTGGVIGLDLEVIIAMWENTLGVEVEISQVEWATYLDDLDAKKMQAYAGLGWQADYPDPQDFLDILFHSESSINHGNFNNSAVDKLLEEARIEPDIVQRIALYNDAERLIVQEAAWVPLWFDGEQYALIKQYVTGYELTPMIVPRLAQVVITP